MIKKAHLRFAAALVAGVAVSQAWADKPPMRVGTKAPAFVTHALDGKPISLKSLRGKVVLLDFWATWCGPCRMSTPTLELLQTKFGKAGFTVIGMSLDDADSRENIAPFRQTYHVTYPLAYDPTANTKTAMSYHTNIDTETGEVLDHPVPPTVFLIDRKGRIRWSQMGYSLNEEKELTPLIKKLLTEKH